MGLHQNGFRDNSGLFRFAGAGTLNGAYPSTLPINTHLTGAQRNITAGDGITDDKVGVPLGYLAGGAWILPQKPGNISARSTADFGLSATGAGVMGYPMTATADMAFTVADAQAYPLDDSSPLRTGSSEMSFTVADADGQLISSGSGAAEFAVTCADLLMTASIDGAGSTTFTITADTALLGAEAGLEGTASFSLTVAPAQAFPINDASPLRDAGATMAFTGSLTPYAIGSMSGSTVAQVDGIDYAALSAAVRAEMATELARIDKPISTRATLADIFAAV